MKSRLLSGLSRPAKFWRISKKCQDNRETLRILEDFWGIFNLEKNQKILEEVIFLFLGPKKFFKVFNGLSLWAVTSAILTRSISFFFTHRSSMWKFLFFCSHHKSRHENLDRHLQSINSVKLSFCYFSLIFTDCCDNIFFVHFWFLP